MEESKEIDFHMSGVWKACIRIWWVLRSPCDLKWLERKNCARAMIADEGTVAQSHDYYRSSVNIDKFKRSPWHTLLLPQYQGSSQVDCRSNGVSTDAAEPNTKRQDEHSTHDERVVACVLIFGADTWGLSGERWNFWKLASRTTFMDRPPESSPAPARRLLLKSHLLSTTIENTCYQPLLSTFEWLSSCYITGWLQED